MGRDGAERQQTLWLTAPAQTPISDTIRHCHARDASVRLALADRAATKGREGTIFFRDESNLPPFTDQEIDDPKLLAAAASELFKMRRARNRVMPADLVGEPGWDMLLALYIEAPVGAPLSSICYAAGTPGTTGLRWIGALAKCGLVDRAPHHRDGRVTLVSLSDRGRLMVERSIKAMLRAASS